MASKDQHSKGHANGEDEPEYGQGRSGPGIFTCGFAGSVWLVRVSVSRQELDAVQDRHLARWWMQHRTLSIVSECDVPALGRATLRFPRDPAHPSTG